MKNQLKALSEQQKKTTSAFRPVFYRISNLQNKKKLNDLLKHTPGINVFDELEGQIAELIKSQQPKIKFSKTELTDAVKKHPGKTPFEEYGVWVYYPWSKRLVHILDESEFIEVRTNRNMYKITLAEREKLAKQKVGVIGLSVGQSVSVTMAMERSFGEIRLADFDLLELTNLNRIRTGIYNLGVSKVISVAREISEIDPFIKVVCYTEGLTEENLDDFFLKGGKLDVLIDECDGLDIKILCRLKAKKLKIPVLMEASDRGMLDVERFDLEPHRPILHGLIDHLDVSKLKTLKTNEEKIPYLLPMIGTETISTRLKASMLEIEQTITTWPQLASAVTLGGGLVADVYRRLVLGQFQSSGRYFVDLEEIVSDDREKKIKQEDSIQQNTNLLTDEEIKQLIDKHDQQHTDQLKVENKKIKELVSAAIMAPSGGNLQPWKWIYSGKNLYLFNSLANNNSLLDFDNQASYIGLGAAAENLVLKTHQLHLEVTIDSFPDRDNKKLVAIFRFFEKINNDVKTEPHLYDDLVETIDTRITNRTIAEKKTIERSKINKLVTIAATVPGAKLKIIDSPKEMAELSDIIAKTERLRLMDETGHKNFVNEIRWTSKEAFEKKDGIDISAIDLTPTELVGFQMAKQKEVINCLKEWDAGTGLEKLSRKTTESASALGFMTMPKHDRNDFFNGGRAVQRTWLTANQMDISIQPLFSSIFLFTRLVHGRGKNMSDEMIHELKILRKEFTRLLLINSPVAEVFIFRLCVAEKPSIKSFRKSLESVLIIQN